MSNVSHNYDGGTFLGGLAGVPANMVGGVSRSILEQVLDKLAQRFTDSNFLIERVYFGVTDCYVGTSVYNRTYQVFIDTITIAYQIDITEDCGFTNDPSTIVFRINGDKEYGNYLVSEPAIQNVLNLLFSLIENHIGISIEEFSRGYLHYYS